MSKASTFRSFYLRAFSKPAHERMLYRWIAKDRPTSIVEFGLGNAQRACRMIEMGNVYCSDRVSYCCIDLFEMSDTKGAITLRKAHRLLAKTGAHVRLLPGDPLTALSRSANTLSNVDMVVSNFPVEAACLASAWYYLPRMMSARASVFAWNSVTSSYHLVDREQIERLAKVSAQTRQAA